MGDMIRDQVYLLFISMLDMHKTSSGVAIASLLCFEGVSTVS